VNRLGEIFRCTLCHKLQPWLRGFLVIDEVWSDVEIADPNADIVVRHQIACPPPGSVAQIFHTLIIDLTMSEEALWKGLKKAARQNIRRAERVGVHVSLDRQGDRGAMDAFERAYGKLQARKAIYPLNKRRLQTFAKRGRLNLSVSETEGGEMLSWHVYFVENGTARLLYSVTSSSRDDGSDRRAFVGRANQFHHWQDILQFRARGCKFLDLYGWYAGSTNRALLEINRFKEGFGGYVVAGYDAMIPLTLKGRIAIAAWRAAMMIFGGFLARDH
jgi:lipid II:glycine glycyltransferase (peptidoglycan interpeptide bridge formation enzyme)